MSRSGEHTGAVGEAAAAERVLQRPSARFVLAHAIRAGVTISACREIQLVAPIVAEFGREDNVAFDPPSTTTRFDFPFFITCQESFLRCSQTMDSCR